jgi:adenosylhomocysteine nucleosidase
MISTIAEKALRFRETGCIAVDMEAAIVRPHSQSAGVPLLHIRAISDTAAEALPERMTDWINDVGVPRMAQVTADLAFHPHLIPAMIRIGNNSRIAARRLAQAVHQILRKQD